MTPEDDIESAAEALWHRDREETGMPPKPWVEVSEFVKNVYRSAITGAE